MHQRIVLNVVVSRHGVKNFTYLLARAAMRPYTTGTVALCSRVVSVLNSESQAQKGLGPNRSHDAVG